MALFESGRKNDYLVVRMMNHGNVWPTNKSNLFLSFLLFLGPLAHLKGWGSMRRGERFRIQPFLVTTLHVNDFFVVVSPVLNQLVMRRWQIVTKSIGNVEHFRRSNLTNEHIFYSNIPQRNTASINPARCEISWKNTFNT